VRHRVAPLKPYAALRPGDYGRFLSRPWLLNRLGFLDDRGAVPPGAERLRDALRHYTDHLVDNPKGHRPVALWSYDSEGDEVPGRVRRARSITQEDLLRRGFRRGQEHTHALSERLALSQLWKARLHLLVGQDEFTGYSYDHFRGFPGFLRAANASALTLFAGAAGGRLAQADVHLPRGDRWTRVGTGPEGMRYIVADVDCKKPRDEHRFGLVMRVLTTTPGVPSPHLIVTSRSGRGRHCYWFTEERTVGFEFRANPVDRIARRFQQRLEAALGVACAPGRLEVLPAGDSHDMPVTYLPFGPGTALCGPDGEVVAEDPLDCLVRWHQQCAEAPVRRLSDDDIEGMSGAGADPLLLAQLREAMAPPAMLDDGGSLPDHPAGGAGSRCGVLLDEVRELFEEGASRHETNQDIPRIARYLRFHHGGSGVDEVSALPLFRRWVGLLVDEQHPLRLYERKFLRFFRTCRCELTTGGVAYRLTEADALAVARAVGAWAEPDAMERKHHLVLMLAASGLARSRHHDGAGPQRLHLASTLMQTWLDGYSAVVGKLRQRGWLRLVSEAVGPDTRRGIQGQATVYELDLGSPAGAHQVMTHHRELLPFLVRVLATTDDALGGALLGRLNWRNAKKRLSPAPAPP